MFRFGYCMILMIVIGFTLLPIVGHTKADVDGLVIYLPMDEGKPLKISEDVSGNGNHGRMIANAKLVPGGKYGGCVELDGKGGSYVDIPWTDSMDVGADDFSAEIWFKYEKGANVNRGSLIWGFNVGGATPQFWIRAAPPNNITSLFWDGEEPNGPIVETPEAYNDNQWHHYAFVRRGAKLDIYVDGQKVGDGEGDEGSVTKGHAFGIHLGQRVDGDNPYQGFLDEFRFWSRQLTKAEIVENAAAGADEFLSVNSANSLATVWGKVKVSR
jgi:sialidase-1